MSMIFTFRMLSDENDVFVREYAVRYDMTLKEFNDFIMDELGYEQGMMTAFFASDGQWNRLREFTLADMGAGEEDGPEAPLAMEGVTLGQIIHRRCDRLIWQFDLLGDRAYYLELIAAATADPQKNYPVVTERRAEAPDQFEPGSARGEGSIFDEAMGEFSDFEGDDSYDDEY